MSAAERRAAALSSYQEIMCAQNTCSILERLRYGPVQGRTRAPSRQTRTLMKLEIISNVNICLIISIVARPSTGQEAGGKLR